MGEERKSRREIISFSVCRIVSEDQCRALAARIARQLSWFLDVDREIRKGDKVALIYQSLPAEPGLKILKLEYVSEFLGKTLEMNFFKIPEMNYGSYFDNRGHEMISRLESRNQDSWLRHRTRFACPAVIWRAKRCAPCI